MEGFFSRKETESKARPDGKIYSCASCALYKESCNPKMKPSGNFRKGILNIGSFNSELEDKKGIQWQGPSGRLLQQTYERLGIDLFEDCLNINAINCYAGEITGNTSYQISCCRKSVIALIEKYEPNVIILFGVLAIESVIGHRWKKDLGDIQKWRGWTIPDKDFKSWICPVYHPDMIDSKKREMMTIWEQDLMQAFNLIEIPIPKYKEPKIEIISDLSILDSISSDLCAFDYEATGKKPHAKGHRLICASIADTKDHAFAFMLPKVKSERKPFINFLTNNLIGKIAANHKYEHIWSIVRLRTEVKNWTFDTMLAAHLMDNRPGITGLKFQVYVRFGVVDYASEITPFLETGDKDGNAINRIEQLIQTKDGINKLLTYCALDSIYEYRLALLQMKEMNFTFLPF